jgi:short-subunit dehydrogenase
MAERALITGATAGIGAEFARQLAARGCDLVLVARNVERLERLAEELRVAHGVDTEVLAADLSRRADVQAVERRLQDSERPAGILVNNAGYGLRRPFDVNAVDEEQALLDVLVTAPLRLCHAALNAMLPRRSGTIINVASVAAYAGFGTYGASKAWLLSFSRWANATYRGRGVTVTAVVPGFVRTEFQTRMQVPTDALPDILWLDPPYVVQKALAAADRGRGVVIPSLRYKLIAAVARVTPPRIAARRTLPGR